MSKDPWKKPWLTKDDTFSGFILEKEKKRKNERKKSVLQKKTALFNWNVTLFHIYEKKKKSQEFPWKFLITNSLSFSVQARIHTQAFTL